MAKRDPQRSLKRSPSQEQEQEQKQEQDTPQAVEHEFVDFWNLYPMRNGKRLGKPEALKKWKGLNAEDRKQVLVAVQHYARSEMVVKGMGIKDPHRWLRTSKDDEPWRDWIEPEQQAIKSLHSGHSPSPTCTKRLQGPSDRFSRPCGQPASPESRHAEPRCVGHLSEASQPKELTYADH